MKNIILLFGLLLVSGNHLAQSNNYLKIKKAIQNEKPELSLENKLIAVNYWKVSDTESRNCNMAFEKAYVTFYKAKLKGGVNGLVVLLVNEGDPSEISVITLSKDGIKEAISVGYSGLKMTENALMKNIIYDAQGNERYKDVPSDKVFSSIQNLITR